MNDARKNLIPLPIDPLLPAIVEGLGDHPCAVVQAPPGAGKSTRLPVALAAAPWLQAPHRRVVLLQPRRVAARATARRIASEQGQQLGQETGYHIRFERRFSRKTALLIATEGILARQIATDPGLDGIGCVILDEFHERHLTTDLTLAMLKEVQEGLREDLRLVVMSATLNAEPLAAYLGNCPVHRSPSRLFPVEIEFSEQESNAPLAARASEAIQRAFAAGEGHVLAFLPGMGEIRRVEQALPPLPGAEIHLLHSSVPAAAQDAALASSARRKVILSTNIAETSVTIDGVRTVVDSGLERVLVNDPRLGLDRLETQRISVASADQRAGRAGRTAPGRCLRLWTRRQHAALPPLRQPELFRADLAATLLTLKSFGVGELAGFPWFEPPPQPPIDRAEQLLRELGALDSQGRLTPRGHALARLPLHPRIGVILLEGQARGCGEQAATLAALLSEGEGVRRNGRPTADSESDVLLAIEDFGPRLPPRLDAVRRDLLRFTRQEDQS